MSYLRFPLLFAIAFIAGLVDSVAGGGGLITVPVLLGIGMPPQDALATNKLQASFGSGSATFHFARAGAVRISECGRGILFTAIGSMAGTLAVQHVSADFLRGLIPFLLIGIAIYLLLSPKLGCEEVKPRLPKTIFYIVIGLGIGFYDGFFGPGTGTFWVMALMLGLGMAMGPATATTKVMNFTSNIVSLGFFLVGGHVHILEGLVMGAGQFLGARVGAGLVLTRGTRFIRPVFLAVVIAVSVKLLVAR